MLKKLFQTHGLVVRKGSIQCYINLIKHVLKNWETLETCSLLGFIFVDSEAVLENDGCLHLEITLSSLVSKKGPWKLVEQVVKGANFL